MIDVVDVGYIEGYKVKISFENGVKGIVNLEDYVQQGGVFSHFSNLDYFKKVRVNKELGTLCWPDGVDIAPETLYSRVTGKSYPLGTSA
ncbi:MAG: DUF2442 domain-containing protein [Elusimicrobia bacterium]|nr:DUF2442 domain-containing protein [Elusimicrobiota bacterium]